MTVYDYAPAERVIEVRAPFGTFECYRLPIATLDEERKYSYPGGRAYTRKQILSVARENCWKWRELDRHRRFVQEIEAG